MVRKGDTYAQVDIDLRAWAGWYMQKENIKAIVVARRAGFHRARMTEILKGAGNKLSNLERIVKNIYGGDYEVMGKFATTDAGLTMLQRLNFEKQLTPYERSVYNKGLLMLKNGIVKDPAALELLLDNLNNPR